MTDLEQLGLTRNESKVYLALLETGETMTGALVKKTALHRVLIYDALEMLIKKGLASYVIKENRKYFQAANPERLVDFLKEKEEYATSLIPELKLRTAPTSQQSVQVYEGLRGLKSALNNMIKELSPGGTHYVFGSGDMDKTLGPYYDIYQESKRKHKIKTYGIVDIEYRKRTTLIKRTSAEIRFYPFNYFPTDTWIYNDKVLIVTYKSSPPVAILITSNETSHSYKKFFDAIWKQAKK
jgi:sugar-specific transcriptional regulator TrmB